MADEKQNASAEAQSPVEPQQTQAQQTDTVNESADAESTDPQAQIAELNGQLNAANERIAELEKELAEIEPRTQAEIQNIRRRAEQDVDKARKFALEKFTNELLPVVDSLERAVEACPADDESTRALREGVEMTLKMFMDGLGKFNVETVDPKGEAFNPEHHQAMSMVDDPNAEPNTVVAVMQKGYLLNGRLVRPAMVVVAKG